ncbi:hypothetical protein D3C73_931310 [compost metagenome]
MHEADAHPVRDHLCGAHGDLREPVAVKCFALPLQFREIAGDTRLDQLPQQRGLAARSRQFKRTKAQERGRYPADDRAGLRARMTVIEHVAHYVLAGTHQRQGAGSRHAEMMHRLAAQELADRRAQHRTAVGAARVRRWPGALQLQFPVPAIGADQLAQRDGATITQLPGPMPELMASIVGRPRLHARIQRVATEHLGEAFIIDLRRIESEHRGHLRRPRQQHWRCNRRRHHRRPGRTQHFAPARAGLGIARQQSQQAVVELGSRGIHEHSMGARTAVLNRRAGPAMPHRAPRHAGRPDARRCA